MADDAARDFQKPKPIPEGYEIVEGLYDMTSDTDLTKIEKMRNRPDLFTILREDLISVPMLHMTVMRPKVRL
jgi:hypothetical protein